MLKEKEKEDYVPSGEDDSLPGAHLCEYWWSPVCNVKPGEEKEICFKSKYERVVLLMHVKLVAKGKGHQK